MKNHHYSVVSVSCCPLDCRGEKHLEVSQEVMVLGGKKMRVGLPDLGGNE